MPANKTVNEMNSLEALIRERIEEHKVSIINVMRTRNAGRNYAYHAMIALNDILKRWEETKQK